MKDDQSYCFPLLRAVLSFSCSCLVISSPSKVGQFSFECCPLIQEISPVIYYLPCFERWLISCACSLRVWHCVFCCLPCTFFLGQVHFSTCPLHCLCLIKVHCLFFSFVGGGGRRISLPRDCTDLCSWGWIGESHVVHGGHLFILPVDVQADLKPAVMLEGRNGTNVFKCSMAWRGFLWVGGSGCHRI
jgi:hypothetical protein